METFSSKPISNPTGRPWPPVYYSGGTVAAGLKAAAKRLTRQELP